MKRWLVCFLICGAYLWPTTLYAQNAPVGIDPPALQVVGNIEQAPLTASLIITTSQPVSNVRMFISDFQDATDDNRTRDPLPASSVTLMPSSGYENLAANTFTQIILQIAAPAQAGIYTGTLTLRWDSEPAGKLVVPLTIVARADPTLALQDPTQITMKATQGTNVVRRVVLHEATNGSPLTKVQSLAQDLVAIDGAGVLAASQINVSLPSQQIAGGGFLTATVNINLQGAPAGTYTGNLLFFAEHGAPLALPMTVNVRHGWFWPFIVMLLGVGLGVILTGYQTRGKVRDQSIIRLAALRQAIQDDAQLKDFFGSRLMPTLEDAEATLRRENWDAATASLDQAELYVRRWRANRAAWLDQFQYLREKLMPRIEGNAIVLRKLQQQAATILAEAADYAAPLELRAKLFDIETVLVEFETVKRRIETVGELRKNSPVDAASKETWRLSEVAFTELLESTLTDSPEWQQLKTEIETLRQTIITESRSATPSGAAAMPRGMVETIKEALLPAGLLLPDVQAISYTSGEEARRRLQNFGWITYALGGLLLAGAGYSTLYIGNPIFGASAIADYLSLLAWGLGAQTTFASVADLLIKWGIPVNKE